MVYLHKSVFQSHGYLSSATCHVDSRWVLKVSGFALHAFRKESHSEQVNIGLFATFLSKDFSLDMDDLTESSQMLLCYSNFSELFLPTVCLKNDIGLL